MRSFLVPPLLCCLQAASCSKVPDFLVPAVDQQAQVASLPFSYVQDTGTTVQMRFPAPQGFHRSNVENGSFGHYLRQLPLKPVGTKVRYYNGDLKPATAYLAVVDQAISNRNLQQCADAIIRLRAEWLYANKAYHQIEFTLTNGFSMAYSELMKGKRLVVKGNQTHWEQKAEPGNSYALFRSYLEVVFTYAGTLSLSKTLRAQSIDQLTIGDVFIIGGSPGHAVIVVDVVENEQGEKRFLLAQSYMPAQETQILRNPAHPNHSPWYSTKQLVHLITPEWNFAVTDLKTW